MNWHKNILLIISGLVAASNCYAHNKIVPREFIDAWKNGTSNLEFRLRYENARQEGLDEARATTLRSRLGYETADFCQSKMRVELVDVANFFGTHFNPGVSDLLKPNYAVIRDPRGAGVTEAKFIYNGFANNQIILGRQYINLDNQRFIGMNNFRQYPQSFDAYGIRNQMIDSFDLYYTFVSYVNTNFANGRGVEGRRNLSTHLIHIEWDGYKYGHITGYGYINKDHTVNTNSNITIGVRFNNPSEYAEFDQFGYTAEVARQQARFNNPNSHVSWYANFAISKTIACLTGLVGVEKLGGHQTGNRAFITPLGSVDDFNGIAEVFNTIPGRGLQDYYAKLSFSNCDFTIAAIYHYFRLDRGHGAKRAGKEIDITAEIALSEQITLTGAYAHYVPKNNVAVNTRRVWIMLNAKIM